jgi:SNF2 family DNA or RNA helicase
MLKAATDLGEKVVVVSTSTQMLDAAVQVCAGLSLPTGRIDGSTTTALRQELVDNFNDTSPATGDLIKACPFVH